MALLAVLGGGDGSGGDGTPDLSAVFEMAGERRIDAVVACIGTRASICKPAAPSAGGRSGRTGTVVMTTDARRALARARKETKCEGILASAKRTYGPHDADAEARVADHGAKVLDDLFGIGIRREVWLMEAIGYLALRGQVLSRTEVEDIARHPAPERMAQFRRLIAATRGEAASRNVGGAA